VVRSVSEKNTKRVMRDKLILGMRWNPLWEEDLCLATIIENCIKDCRVW
jgi:hypothetical protein